MEILPEFNERPLHDILVDIAQLLTDNVTELKHIRAMLGSTSRSSVELAENSKGAVQITVKCYEGSQPDEACIDAVAAFRTLKAEVELGQMQQWSKTIDGLKP